MRSTAIWRISVAVAIAVIGGVTLGSLFGGEGEDSPPSAAGQRLSKYEAIPLKGKGASEADEAMDGGRLIAAAEAGRARLFFYVEGKRCGVYVTSPDPKKVEDRINLLAGAPEDVEPDDDSVPGGPYMKASISGGVSGKPAPAATLACADGTMYVEYDAAERAKATNPTGPVAVADSGENPGSTVFVVGRDSTRQAVLEKVAG
ncbi:hypothetical protein [Streptomyces boninensis]|uniref:hypothetical protein n=1 Tax=Streptomyces boninensis TaxID=2039455 RepID=UPI003B21CFA9